MMIRHQERDISAVLDKELEKFLIDIGEYERIVSGGAKCSICGSVISKDNIALLVPKKKKVAYVCQQQMCMLKYTLGDLVDD